MRRSSKEQFIELPPGEDHRYMLLWILSKLSNGEATLVLLAAAAICWESVASTFSDSQL